MGSFSNLGGATQCEACGLGFYQEQVGASTCEKCDVGQWANRTESTACIQCHVEETTLERASTSVWDCVCKENSYREVGHSEANSSLGSCLSCQKDLQGNWVMECPPSNDEPRILAGFWASPEDRATRVYSIFSCRSDEECLTGYAGENCAAGRVGRSCANCALDFKPGSSGTCTACDSNDATPAVVLVVGAFLFICAIVHYARTDVNKVHVATLAMGVCVSQAAVAVQTLAIFNGIQVDWMDPMRSLLAVVSVVSLSFEDLSISCMVGDSQVVLLYFGKLTVFPTCIALLILMFFILSRFGKPLRLDAVLNSVGVLFLILFLTLAMVALEPFHCVMNPNGTHSMYSNPSVECATADTWWGLAVLGCVAVLVYCVIILHLGVVHCLLVPTTRRFGTGLLGHESVPVPLPTFHRGMLLLRAHLPLSELRHRHPAHPVRGLRSSPGVSVDRVAPRLRFSSSVVAALARFHPKFY